MSSHAESISLEETNKIRISMGLKPLADPNAAPAQSSGDGEGGAGGIVIEKDADQIAQENYQRRVEEEKRARDQKEAKERIAKAQNRLALNAKLKGSSLGAAADGGEDDDAVAWIKKQKKRAKQLAKEMELAKKREAEQAELDKGAYEEEDLSGLKVAHDMDEFGEGQEMILTLKDNKILGGDEDELENVNLADYNRERAARDRKRKAKQQYTGLDDEEFEEGNIGPGAKRQVLSKYDDEYSGAGRSEGFRLGSLSRKSASDANGQGGDGDEIMTVSNGSGVNRQMLSLDYTKNFDVSDYATEDNSKFKKKKKKTKGSSRRAEASAEDSANPGGDAMEDVKPIILDRTVDENLVDDDELQMALARQRRTATKKSANRRRPEDVAAEIAARRQEQEGSDHEDDATGRAGDGSAVTFDDTSEFVRNVSLDNLVVKREPRPRSRSESVPAATAGPSSAAGVGAVRVKVEEPEDVKPTVVKIETGGEPLGGYDIEMAAAKDEESDDEDEILAEMALRQGLSLEEMRAQMDREMQDSIKQEEEDDLVGKPEPLVAGGMAGVLSMLKKTGVMEQRTPEQIERERLQKQRDLWLADHRRRVAQRELEKVKARGGQKDQAQREWEAKVREQQEAREALKSFDSYKPDVNIVYTDEFGRTMTPKEAWKSLSHKFHGKTSGRQKTELRLRRIEEERRRAAVASSESSGMINAFARRQEQTGEAHMVLSVGNRSYVPMADGSTLPSSSSSSSQRQQSRHTNGASHSGGSGGGSGKKSQGPKVLG